MKKGILGLLVLGIVLGYSGLSFADTQNFPVNFAANFADQNANTLVKVEGNELRLSVSSADGTPIQDYLVDADQGTIAKSSGEMVTKGGEGWQATYDAVMSSLNSVKTGLAESGDSNNATALGSTISFMQGWTA